MKKTNLFTVFIILIFTSLIFSSCRNSPHYSRYDVSNFVSYLEAPPEYELGQILPRSQDFKPLNPKNMGNLNKLLTEDGNYIWLKIQFILPDELKNKGIGLFIGYLRGADILFINNTGIRQYGNFEPYKSTAGFVTQYFMFPNNTVNQDGLNTVLIKVWPGAFGSLSTKIFIGESADIYKSAETMTFFNSKITISFAGTLLIFFFIYIFL